jgi:hypothetical protein
MKKPYTKITLENTALQAVMMTLAQILAKGAMDKSFPEDARIAFMKLNNLMAFLLLSGEKFNTLYDLIAISVLENHPEAENEPSELKKYREKSRVMQKDYYEMMRRASGG